VTIDELHVADDPQAWRAVGFTVDDDDVCRVGTVRIRLVGGTGEVGSFGIIGWSLRGSAAHGDVDGLATSASDRPAAEPAEHANGTTHLDHLVVMSPDLDRTVSAFEAIGLEVRRVRDFELGGTAMQQVFFRLGEVILELVGRRGEHGDGPATFWGLTHTVTDLDATAQVLGDGLGRVKDAVQPGRRIATLRNRDLGISVATAFMTPRLEKAQRVESAQAIP
jgi:hypothetical protein